MVKEREVVRRPKPKVTKEPLTGVQCACWGGGVCLCVNNIFSGDLLTIGGENMGEGGGRGREEIGEGREGRERRRRGERGGKGEERERRRRV